MGRQAWIGFGSNGDPPTSILWPIPCKKPAVSRKFQPCFTLVSVLLTYLPLCACTSVLIAALICSGSPGQASTRSAKSGSKGCFGARRAPDFAHRSCEIGVFDSASGGCSCPARRNQERRLSAALHKSRSYCACLGVPVVSREWGFVGLRSRFPVVTSGVDSLRSPYRAATRRENGPLRLKMTTAT